MEFFCKYSAKNLKFFQKLEEEGNSVAALESMPELYFDAVPFWEAFANLSSSRQSGMGLGAIPYSEITSWLTENQIISFENRERYRYFVTFIDGKYLELKNDDRKIKKGKK